MKKSSINVNLPPSQKPTSNVGSINLSPSYVPEHPKVKMGGKGTNAQRKGTTVKPRDRDTVGRDMETYDH